MSPHVNHQVIIPYKPLSALGAQKLFGIIIVELYMLCEVRLGYERLIARSALESLVTRVTFHMNIPVFLGGEAF